MRTIIKNGKVITPFRLIENGGVVVEGRKIIEVFQGQPEVILDGDRIIDAGCHYISPGFIDIHTHGGGGHDFMDGTLEAMVEGCKTHMFYGTTSIVPTTITSTMDELYNTFDNLRKARETMRQGPNILGIHLEGPYFSMEQKGAQDPQYIKKPDKEEYQKILNRTNDIIRWTVAPELDGALEMGDELRRRGVLACIGHSDAVYEQVVKAYEHGYTHITHLYSGMSTVKRINAYRYAGVVESAYLIDGMTVEIIADGKHLPESLLKLIYKIKGADGICLVTDSMRAAGMPEGETILGSLKNGKKVIVEDGVAKLMDRTAFAGSVATADRLVRTMVKKVNVPLREAVQMMTYTPAKVIGIDKDKGSLSSGKDADIIVFDQNICVSLVMVKGEICLNRECNDPALA